MESLKKKYGLATGIAMVVGIVIGSGVFFKAGKVLVNTDGKLGTALFAWLIGGLIMVISAYCFGLVGTKIEKVNGVVDYVEVATNKSRICSRLVFCHYLLSNSCFNSSIPIDELSIYTTWNRRFNYGGLFWLCVVILIFLSFLMNTLAPKIAGYYQVSTTIIKLIPISIIAIVGTIIGLTNGNTAEALNLLVITLL